MNNQQYTIKNIEIETGASALKIRKSIKKLFPHKMVSSVITYLTREEAYKVIKDVEATSDNKKVVSSNQVVKAITYSISELARMINIPNETVRRTANKLFPTSGECPNTSRSVKLLSEEQAAVITKALKETGRGKMATISKKDQPTTKLEVMSNYMSSVAAMKDLMETEINILKQSNATKAIQIEDLTEKNEVVQQELVTSETSLNAIENMYHYDSNDCIKVGDWAKQLGIKSLGKNNLFKALREVGLLFSTNLPYQRYNSWFNVISVTGEYYSANVTLIRKPYISKIIAKLQAAGYIKTSMLI